MSRILAIALPCSFWLGSHAAPGPQPTLVVLLAGAILLGVLLRRPSGALPLLLAAAAGGALCGVGVQGWRAATPDEPPTLPLEATVAAVTLRGPWVDLVLAPDAHPDHRLVLRRTDRAPGLAPGARVRVSGRARALPPADEPGGWDAAARGARDHVVWRVRGALDIRRPAAAGWPLRAREAARARLDRSRHPYGAAVLTGLLLGDRAAVPPGAREALQGTGTGHLLAVSGLHVGGLALVLGGLVLRLARRWPAVHPDRWAAAGALPAVAGFVTLAQFPLSACRAGLMVGLYLVARGLGRRADGVVLLGWAALILLAGGPEAGGGAGFQLSFGAVGALLWLGDARSDGARPVGQGRAGARLRSALATALVAAAATAPIEAWHFGTVAPIAPLANLLLCPLAALVLVPLGLLGLLLAPLSALPLDIAAAGAEVLVAVAETLAGWSDSQIVGRHMAPAVAIPLAFALGLRTRRARPALATALALAGLSLAARPAGTTVDFLPIGQGDAVLVRSAGRALLVDAGPDPDGFRLLGALRRAGVRRLDGVWITHAHPDHFAGLAALLDRVTIDGVWFNGRRGGRAWRRLAARLEQRGVPLRVARPGRFSLGRARVRLIGGGDPATPSRRALSENDASLTLRIDGPAASVLLTGDIEAAGEARLLATDPAPISVLKAPHHGSRTSSAPALLARLCPAAVIYTVGRHNRFGLPHPAVLARYAAAGVDGYRTDRDGRVTVDLDHARLRAHRRPERALPPAGCWLSGRTTDTSSTPAPRGPHAR